MLRLLKWTIAGLFTLCAILVIGFLWFISTTDPNSYKPYLEKLAAQQGVELEIKGDIGWQLVPDLAITVSDTHLAVPEQGIDQLSFQQLNLALDKSRLLQRQVVFRTIEIKQANIVARSIADAGKVVAAPAGAQRLPEGDSALPVQLALQQLQFIDATIRILQSKEGQSEKGQPEELLFEKVNLEMTPDLDNLSFPVNLSFSTRVQESTPVSITLNSQINLDSGNKDNSLDALLKTDIANAIQKMAVQFSDTVIKLSYDQLPITLKTAGEYQFSSDQLKLDGFELNALTLKASGSITANNLTQQPTISGNIAVPSVKLASLPLGQYFEGLSFEGLSNEELPVKSLGIDTHFNIRPDHIALNQLQINADKQRLEGRLSFKNSAPRNFELILESDQLTLSESSSADNSPQADGSQASSAGSETSISNEKLLTPLLAPLAILDGGKGHIELTLGQLSLPGYQIANLHINLFSNANVIRLSDLSGNIFGGAFKGDGRIDLRQQTPAVSFSKQLNNIDLKQALGQLAEVQDISGKLTMNFAGNTRGDNIDKLQRNANGKGNLLITQPVLNNLNIEKSLCETTSLLSQKAAPDFTDTLTRFTDIRSNLAINNGIAHLDNLTTSTGNIALTANGKLDTIEQLADVLMTTTIQGATTSETGCSVNKRLRNIGIPVRCAGPLKGDISCKPDSSFMENLLKKALLDEVTRRFLKDKTTQQPAAEQSTTEESPAEEAREETRGQTDLEKAQEAIDLLRGIFNQ